VSEALKLVQFEREADNTVPDRRSDGGENWFSPRIILTFFQLIVAIGALFVAVVGIFVVVFGGLIGTYVVMQTRTATSEVSNQTLVNEVQKVSAKLDAVGDDVKEIATVNTQQTGQIQGLDSKIQNLDKSMEDLKTEVGIVSSKLSVDENKIAKLEATVK